jgi:hypothetical protein
MVYIETANGWWKYILGSILHELTIRNANECGDG